MGITEKPTVFGNAVRVYDKERTICDLIAGRGQKNQVSQSTRYYCCISSDAIEYPYRSVFEDDKTVKVMSYNLETIIAEKLETVASRKTGNSRSKDFYDLYLLINSKSDNLDKNKLREAVNTTFAYRNTELDANSILSDLNDIQSNAGFRKRWELYCKRNAYVGELSFDHPWQSC